MWWCERTSSKLWEKKLHINEKFTAVVFVSAKRSRFNALRLDYIHVCGRNGKTSTKAPDAKHEVQKTNKCYLVRFQWNHYSYSLIVFCVCAWVPSIILPKAPTGERWTSPVLPYAKHHSCPSMKDINLHSEGNEPSVLSIRSQKCQITFWNRLNSCQVKIYYYRVSGMLIMNTAILSAPMSIVTEFLRFFSSSTIFWFHLCVIWNDIDVHLKFTQR